MSTFLHDARLAWRQWRASPRVAVVAILALTLGIGSTVSVFSFTNAILLRPLPFRDPDGLVHVWETDRTYPQALLRASLPNVEDWKAQSRSFASLAIFNYTEENLVENSLSPRVFHRFPNLGGAEAERISVGRVSANVFDVLGVAPALGRTLEAGEDRPGRPDVAVLSFDCWTRRYRNDPRVIGQQIVLNDRPYEIVGVMPAGFHFPLTITQVWAPHVLDAARYPRTLHTFQVVGRLAPGSTLADAQADLTRVAGVLARQYPDSNQSAGVRIVPLRQALNFAFDIFQPMSVALAGAVGLVLLVACANVASVLLARAVGRRREIAIRLALGSSRPRLLRQLLTESVLLALAGGAGGVLLAWRELAILDAAIPEDIYRVGRIGLDLDALVVALIVSLVTAVLVGFAPAWRASRRDLRAVLNETALASTAAPHVSRAQSVLVAAQLALTVALLVAAALLIQSVTMLQRVDPGFDPSVLSMKVVLPRETYGGESQLRQFHDRVLARARQIPGVEAAAIVNYLPLNHENDVRRFSTGTARQSAQLPFATVVTITPDYFRTMGIPVRAGRTFTAGDSEQAPRVVIVSEAVARRFFQNQDPLGQPLRLIVGNRETAATIVGVVAESRFQSLAGAEPPQIYVAQAQEPWRYMRVVARGRAGIAQDLVEPLRGAIESVHPGLPVSEVRPLSGVLDEFLLPVRGMSRALVALAIGELLLAVVGLYGLMAYFVSQRRREIAIRMVLGAAPREVTRIVLARAARIAGAGVLVGAAVALGLGRLVATFLYGVSPTDLVTLGTVVTGVIVVSLLASYGPVRRAARVNPIEPLRHG